MCGCFCFGKHCFVLNGIIYLFIWKIRVKFIINFFLLPAWEHLVLVQVVHLHRILFPTCHKTSCTTRVVVKCRIGSRPTLFGWCSSGDSKFVYEFLSNFVILVAFWKNNSYSCLSCSWVFSRWGKLLSSSRSFITSGVY